MYIFVISLIIFISILLVIVVLAQNSKGGGLSSQFGGSGASNIMGVKKTGDLLEKLTWTFIVAIMVLAMATTIISPNSGTNRGNELLDKANEQGTTAPAPIPRQDQGPERTAPIDSAE